MTTTETITHNDTEYDITLDGEYFSVRMRHDGITERVAKGTWDGSFGGDCDAVLGDDLWHEIEMALIDMEPMEPVAKYTGPEIATNYAMAEMCNSPEWHCELGIDWETREITLDSVHDSDDSWTGREHAGHETTYRVDMMTADDFAAMVKALLPMVDKMADAYSSEWDGSNHVAAFALDHDVREDLNHEIENTIQDARSSSVGGVWDAAEYLESDPPEVTGRDNSGLNEMAAEIQGNAHDDGIHLHDIEEYLRELRDEDTE